MTAGTRHRLASASAGTAWTRASAFASPCAPGPRRLRASAWGVLLLAGALLLAPPLAPAQSSSASFEIPRQSIDAGGGRATSASFTLNASIGQADAGGPLASASFTLRGGFHVAAGASPPDRIFASGFEAP